jgi:hypothetical protein
MASVLDGRSSGQWPFLLQNIFPSERCVQGSGAGRWPRITCLIWGRTLVFSCIVLKCRAESPKTLSQSFHDACRTQGALGDLLVWHGNDTHWHTGPEKQQSGSPHQLVVQCLGFAISCWFVMCWCSFTWSGYRLLSEMFFWCLTNITV